MSKQNMMKARNLTDESYYATAAEIGRRIDFNKKLLQLLIKGGMVGKFFDLCQQSQQCESWDELETFAQSGTDDGIRLVAELLRARELMEEEWLTPNGIIATHIRSVRSKDFERWGDRNHLAGQIKRTWIRDTAMPLDIALIEVEEMTGQRIEPDQVCEFITQHPAGLRDIRCYQILLELEKACRTVVGFVPRWTFVKKAIELCATLTTVDDEVPF